MATEVVETVAMIETSAAVSEAGQFFAVADKGIGSESAQLVMQSPGILAVKMATGSRDNEKNICLKKELELLLL